MRIAQPPNLRKRPSNNPKKKKSDEHQTNIPTREARDQTLRKPLLAARVELALLQLRRRPVPLHTKHAETPPQISNPESNIESHRSPPPPPKSPRKTNPLPSSSSRRARRRRRPMRRRGPSRRGDPSTSHRGGANKNPKKRRGEERERGGDGAKRWG